MSNSSSSNSLNLPAAARAAGTVRSRQSSVTGSQENLIDKVANTASM